MHYILPFNILKFIYISISIYKGTSIPTILESTTFLGFLSEKANAVFMPFCRKLMSHVVLRRKGK
jgi:hypothetical protein